MPAVIDAITRRSLAWKPVPGSASVSHGGVRMQVLRDSAGTARGLAAAKTAQDSLVASRPGAYRTATAEQVGQMASLLDRELAAGGLGLGYGINYTPGAAREEIYRLFALAARRGVTNFVHHRGGGPQHSGGMMDSMQELIADVATTGASLHIVHITSSSQGLSPAKTQTSQPSWKRRALAISLGIEVS